MEKKKQINLKMSEELYYELELYSKEQNKTITKSINIAIKNLINENNDSNTRDMNILKNTLFKILKNLEVDTNDKIIFNFLERLYIDDVIKLIKCAKKYSLEGRPDKKRTLPGFLKWAEWNLGIY